MKISISIITKNRWQDIKCCLKCILKQTEPIDELIIIDSSTNDDTERIVFELLKKVHFSVIYVREKSDSYSVQRNTAIKISTSPWLIFLDDDCLVGKNWFKYFQRTIHKYSKSQYKVITGLTSNMYPQSVFSCAFQYAQDLWFLQNTEDAQQLSHLAIDTRNTAYNIEYLKKFHIFFNEDIQCGEDIYMGSTLRKRHVKATSCKECVVYHKWPRSFSLFVKKKFYYYSAAIKLKKIENCNIKYRKNNSEKIFSIVAKKLKRSQIIFLYCLVKGDALMSRMLGI